MAVKVDDSRDIDSAYDERFNDPTNSPDLQDFDSSMDDKYGDAFSKLDNSKDLGEAARDGEQGTSGAWANNTTAGPKAGKQGGFNNFMQKAKMVTKNRGAVIGIVTVLGGGAAVPFLTAGSLPFSLLGNQDAKSMLLGLQKYSDDYLGFKIFGPKTGSVNSTASKIKGLTDDEITQLKAKGVEFRGGKKSLGKTTFTGVRVKGGDWVASGDAFAREMKANPAFRKTMVFTRSGYFKSLKSLASADVNTNKYRINANPDIDGEDDKARAKKIYTNTIDGSSSGDVFKNGGTSDTEEDAKKQGATQGIIDGVADEVSSQSQLLQDATEITSDMGRNTDMSNIATQVSREAVDTEGAIKGIGGKIWGFVNSLDLADLVCTTYQMAHTAAVIARTVAVAHYVSYAMQLRAVIERTKAGDDTKGDTNFLMNIISKRDPITGLAFDSTAYAAFLFTGKVSEQPDSVSVFGGQSMIALNMGLMAIHSVVGAENPIAGRSTLKAGCSIVTNLGVQIVATIGGLVTGGLSNLASKATSIGIRELAKKGLGTLREGIIKNFSKDAIKKLGTNIAEEGAVKFFGARAWKGFSTLWKSLDGMAKVGLLLTFVSTFGMSYIIDILSGMDVAALLNSGPMSMQAMGTGWESYTSAVAVAAGGTIASFALYNKYRGQIQSEQARYVADMTAEASDRPFDITTPYSQLGAALVSIQKTIGLSASTDMLATLKSVAMLPLQLPSFGAKAQAGSEPSAEVIAQKVGDEYALDSGVARTITGASYVLFEKTLTYEQFLEKFVDSPNPQVTYDGSDETTGEPKYSIVGSDLLAYKEECRNPLRTETDLTLAMDDTYYDMGKCTDNRNKEYDDAIRHINQTSPDQRANGSSGSSTDTTGAIVNVGPKASGAQAPWGGYKNGEIPQSAMTEIPLAKACTTGYGANSPLHAYLHPKATISVIELNRRFKEQFGHDIYFKGCYRDLAEQQRAKANEGSNAATPGTSNHGWGLAIDFQISAGKSFTYSSQEYKWMLANAYKVGWVNPPSMQQGGSGPHEPWHWEYAGSTETADPL